ncbi:hypothetical protein [Haladaptatus litoreus]|uniref:hypothetical protein n=1 Tax=Haladaptatus litoreus TaxID=553468 RepID=UPI00111557CC|nr:hypothetical protein [Haladaptatus litoreus]
MDSHSNQRWYGSDAVRVHHPGLQVRAYGCVSFASVLGREASAPKKDTQQTRAVPAGPSGQQS